MKKAHLLEFYGDDCPHCERMRELTVQLEQEEGLTFERIEVWNNLKHEAYMNELARGGCDGVPFFYNTKTHESLCGEVSYKKMKTWATK